MIHCIKCGYEGPRGVLVFDAYGGSREYCSVCRPSRNVTPALNPFENFTLQHVRDHNNKPITVNSISELRKVEKEHNVALAIASDDGGRADKPPQHESWAGRIDHGKPRVWNRDPAAYSNPSGVSTGTAADAHKDTLIDRPNATVI